MKAKCRECNRTTKHEIVRNLTETTENGLATPFNYDITYWKIIKCGGCETISFCMSKHLSNDEKHTIDFLYPLRERRLRKEFPNAPATIQILYHETIGSFNNLHKTLCVAGIRAIFEAICLDKKIEGKKEIKKRACCKAEYEKLSNDLKTKIILLADNNYITADHSDAIQKLRIIGNNTLHQIKTPSDEKLETALGLIEDTINYIYEIKHKGRKLHTA
jgi:hypothetical protein